MIPPLAHGLVDVSLVVLGHSPGFSVSEPPAPEQAPAIILHPLAVALVVLVVVIAANGWRVWRRGQEPAAGDAGS